MTFVYKGMPARPINPISEETSIGNVWICYITKDWLVSHSLQAKMVLYPFILFMKLNALSVCDI